MAQRVRHTSLLADLREHLAGERHTDAATTLAALNALLPRHLTAATAAEFHDQHLALLSAVPRCGPRIESDARTAATASLPPPGVVTRATSRDKDDHWATPGPPDSPTDQPGPAHAADADDDARTDDGPDDHHGGQPHAPAIPSLSPPYDACPECRAGHTCSRDAWPQAIAVALTGAARNLNPRTAGPWLGPDGRVARHAAAGRRAVAAHAAWLVTDLLTATRPEDAELLTDLAADLGLTEPRLTYRRANALARTDASGNLDAAIALINQAATARAGSTDTAWADLMALRDALEARRTASRRGRPDRPPRRGHSAPADRPSRRRFTAAHLAAETQPSQPLHSVTTPRATV